MSAPTDPTGDPRLDPCGCCAVEVAPPSVANRPGQPAIAYRIATHGTAFRRMLAGLPTKVRVAADDRATESRPLRALTSRSADDPAIAMLDAWATVTDVLTFYQERIANEGFLRTATERLSVLELARTIGYELSPGVAASAFLAFVVEDAPGAPRRSTVAAGTKIQSIPTQGQLPQTFETAEEIETRADWNALRPRRTRTQDIQAGETKVYLKGIATQLQPGDALLFVGDERLGFAGSERWDLRVVQTVTPVPPDPAEPGAVGHTIVSWDLELGSITPAVDPAAAPRVYVFRQRAALFGHNAPDWRTMPDSVKDAFDPEKNSRTQWPDFEIQTTAERRIDLDADYPKILAGSWLVLARPGYQECYRAVTVESASRTDFALTAKTTRIEVDTREHLSWFGLRDTIVFAQSEELARAEQPIAEPVQGRRIALDRLVSGLTLGRTLVVTGRRMRAEAVAAGLVLQADDGSDREVPLQPGDSLTLLAPTTAAETDRVVWRLVDRDGFAGTLTADAGALVLRPAARDDPFLSEVAVIADRPGAIAADRDATTLELGADLQNAFDPLTVTINANVVRATHGETVGNPVASLTPAAPDLAIRGEVLGSGNGAIPNQQFALKRPPLTYVSAPTATGSRSTLEVRVNRALWQEVPSLFGLTPQSQAYIVRIDANGATRVVFGDGEMGARAPTGAENVLATYRSGIGLVGMVDAGALSLLQVRPLGIRGVSNPLPASGAADPESLDDARSNAPLKVLTLDRIVSLRDFEDFSRAFAGIGKAQAVDLWQGTNRVVHVTVAGVAGVEVPPESDLYVNLVRAIAAQRDPSHRVEVAGHKARRFSLRARLRVDPRLLAADVIARAAGALGAAFAFDRRAFGQPATAAEVIATLQGTEGVVAVDLDWLRPDNEPPPEEEQPVAVLPAHSARLGADGTIAPAELLLVNPNGIDLEAVTA